MPYPESSADREVQVADLWDRIDNGSYHRTMPPETLSEAKRQETQSIFVTGESTEGGPRWNVEVGEHYAHKGGPFATLAEAKACGDEVLEEAYRDYPVGIVREVGLDPAEWTFKESDDYLSFENKVDVSVSLVRDRKAWYVYGGVDDDVPHKTPLEAATAYAASLVPPPGP